MTTAGSDLAFLKRAVDVAAEHMRAGHGKPFGAVLVRDGEVLAEGWNATIATGDPTSHAEIEAIRAACRKLGTSDLSGSVLYASGEPCPMCLGAMFLSRVSRAVYATTVDEATRIGNTSAAIYAEYPKPPAERSLPSAFHHLPEASALFDEWLARAT